MIRITIPPGWTINRAVEKSIVMAKAADVRISFVFNSLLIEVTPQSEASDVLYGWTTKFGKAV